jgi:transaldolase
MEIWIDTADVDLVRQAKEMGILHGVTTNPTIVAKSGRCLEDLLEQLLQVQAGPVTVQVTADRSPQMIEQGRAIYQFSNRLIVKVPVTHEGLKTIHALSAENIPTMATAIFDPTQVLLAARAGATYVAPYVSTVFEGDQQGGEEIKAMLHLLRRYQLPSKMLAASLKSGDQVRYCLEMGADAITLNKEIFSAFIENHPDTMKRVERFAKDWQEAKERRSLPL